MTMTKSRESYEQEIFPAINYVMKISKDREDWASKIAYELNHKIKLATVNCTQTAYHGRMFVPSRYEKPLLSILKRLRKSGDIKEYELEDKASNILSVYIVAKDPRVCSTIQKNKFELLSPIVITKDFETYEIRSFGEKKSNAHITALQAALEKLNIRIEKLIKKVSVPHASWSVPLLKFDDDAIKVIEHLVARNYFDINKRDITQKEIAKKVGISTAKVNEIIRNIELVGFKNLISIHPDLNEFNTILTAVLDSEGEE